MTDAQTLTSHWASTEISFVGRGWGGRSFEGGCLLTFWAFIVHGHLFEVGG